jgi:hypothetical protein
MKVAFIARAMAIFGTLPEDDAREARDLIRRLRAATTPVGTRVEKKPPQYEASVSPKGVLLRCEVAAGVATLIGVVSSARRALAESNDDTSGEPASRG